MRLSTRIRYGLARLLLKAGGLPVLPSWVRAGALDYSYNALTREGYRKNAVVFSCISALAFAFPEPPLLVYASDEPDAQPLPRHPLRRRLARPNPLMGERELWMYTITYAALGGNAYWHKVRNAQGQVIELWPYSRAQMAPVSSTDPAAPWVERYTYDPGDGQLVSVPAADVVHFKWPSVTPSEPWLAQAPLQAVAAEVDADNEMSAYLRSVLLNDAVPRIIVKQPADRFMSDDEVDRAKARFRAEYGSANKGSVMFLENGADIERLGMNLQELAFDALHRVPESRIAAALRVPPIIAGLLVGLERATYSNYGEARRAFAQETLAPLWALWSDEVQNSLADELGVYVRHDLSRVQSLQEDTTARWQRIREATAAGYLTINEARQAIGYRAVPGADVLIWGATIYPVPVGAVGALAQAELTAAQNPPQAQPAQITGPTVEAEGVDVVDEGEAEQRAAPAPRESKSLTAARRTARALQRIRRRVERRMERDVGAYFDDLADAVVQRAEDGSKADDLPEAEQLFLEIDGKRLLDLVSRYYVEIIGASWETWNLALGLDVAFEVGDPAVAAALKVAATQVAGINTVTLEALRELLAYGAEQGWSVEQLVRGTDERAGLRSLVQETYKGRAKTIARTELGEAQNSAAVARYRAAGAPKVMVLDNGFDDSDPTCTDLDGTVQSLDWAQRNRLQHPNCVRAFAPYFED
jgi:HK97 family phage portal protein